MKNRDGYQFGASATYVLIANANAIRFLETSLFLDFDCYENTSKIGDMVKVKRRSAPASQTTKLQIIRRRGLVEEDSTRSLCFFDLLHHMYELYNVIWVKRCRGPARLQNCKSSGEDRWNATLLRQLVFQLVSKSVAKKVTSRVR